MAHRTVQWLVAILAVVPLATACGVEVTGTASSLTNGLENRTSSQVREAAIDALTRAGSVHITGTATDDSGRPARFDIRVQGSSYTGDITVQGANVAVTVIGDTQYFKTDAAGWQALGSPEAAPMLADRWVKAPAGTINSEGRFTIDLLIGGIRQEELGMRTGVAQSTRDGAKVVVVTYRNGDTLYVANTGQALPLRIDSATTGALDFSEHGADFHITAPPDAVDPTQL